MIATRREPWAFLAGVAALGALFVVQACQSTTLLDDWVQLGWLGDHGLDLALIARVARYNYYHFNPRIGDVFLLLVNGSFTIHVILTPLFQIMLLWTVFATAFGRWPRPRYRDLELLLFLQAMIWIVVPIPGVVYFYRPFATNYLFGFATTLALVAPYRIALERPVAMPDAWWRLAAMFAVGWVAGMSNEHTGPAAIAAVALALGHGVRRRCARWWMLSGTAGVCIGYAMLLFAPGQAERYAGRAAQHHPLGLIASRGVSGNYDIIAGFVAEVQWGIYFMAAALLMFVVHHQRSAAKLPAISRGQLWTIAGMIAAAGAIVVTLFASPVTVERLLFAPGVLLVGAFAVIADHLFASRVVRRSITCACALIFAYHAFRFVQVHAVARAENQQRIAILEAARPGTTAIVPPYASRRSRWYAGDDFRMASIREYVAHELYHLEGIEYDDRPIWAEPTPPEHLHPRRVYEPPLPSGAVPPDSGYVSRFPDVALAQLRKQLVLGSAGELDGHRLVRYELEVTDAGFVDPSHRPLRALVWTPAGATWIDGEGYEDRDRQPAIRIWAPTMPARWTDSYVVGCGTTRRVDPTAGPPGDLLLPLSFACRGSYTGIVCEPDACWIAGRFWR